MIVHQCEADVLRLVFKSSEAMLDSSASRKMRSLYCFLLFSLQASEEDKVLICCLDSSMAAIRKSHDVVQNCFDELCQSAIKTVCQVQWMLMICTECTSPDEVLNCFLKPLHEVDAQVIRSGLITVTAGRDTLTSLILFNESPHPRVHKQLTFL